MKLHYMLIFLLSYSSCKKEKPAIEQLPSITQTGANTFGCLINGKAWKPKGWDGHNPSFYVIVDPGFDGNFHIKSYRYIGGKKESFSIFCYDIHREGEYVIN